MANLKKITLFIFMYWKISRLKFGAHFKKAVKQIRSRIKRKLKPEDFDRLMHYNRYIKKDKRLLFSKSFNRIDFEKLFQKIKPGDPSPIQYAIKNRGPTSNYLNLNSSSIKQVSDNIKSPMDMPFYLLQKMKECSPSVIESRKSIILASRDDMPSRQAFIRDAIYDIESKSKIEDMVEVDGRDVVSQRILVYPIERDLNMIRVMEVPECGVEDGEGGVEKKNIERPGRIKFGGLQPIGDLMVPEMIMDGPTNLQGDNEIPTPGIEIHSGYLEHKHILDSSADPYFISPRMAEAVKGLEHTFHVLVKEDQIKKMQDEIDPKKIIAMLTDPDGNETATDNQLFVLLIKNYFYNHSFLRQKLEMSDDVINININKAVSLVDQEDSHLIPEDIKFEADIDDYLQEHKKMHRAERKQGNVAILEDLDQSEILRPEFTLGDDFLDNDRDSVASADFPYDNMNPTLHDDSTMHDDLVWIEVCFMSS